MNLRNKIIQKIYSVIKWMSIGVLIGVMGGLLGGAFHMSVDAVTEIREHHPYILYFLPVGGVLIAFVYRRFRDKGNIDTKRVFQAVKENKDIPIVMIPLIFIGTVITHMFGGSAGREGAALQLGGSMGYNLAKKLNRDESSTKQMVTAGMSSVFTALFGVPFAATVFSLEVTRKDKFDYTGLFIGFLSSVVAFFVSQMLHVEPVRFNMPAIEEYQITLFLKTALLAVLCAGVCILFALALQKTESFMKKFLSNCYVRAAMGGLLIVLLTTILGTTDYNGAGMQVIENAVSGNAKNSAFIMKIIFTAITVAAGFKGGEIVPTFFIGATFGCVMGRILGIDAGIGASLGLIALFSGMTKCPIASLLLAIEVFGAKGIPLFAVSVLITFIFSGRFGLYDNTKEKRKQITK